MRQTATVLLIDDDTDDQEMLLRVFEELGVKNPVIIFDKSVKLLGYLVNTKETIFLILCDVNMPGVNGIELRRIINDDSFLRTKSIPFVFYTTAAVQHEVNEAYEMMVQGYFEKPHEYEKIKATIKIIIDYWRISIHPNNWRG